MGLDARQPKTGSHFGLQVTANVARQYSGALFYVTVKVDLLTMMCFRLLLLLYSKPNWLLEFAIP